MPKISKPAASAFMLFRANFFDRVRAQELLSDLPEESFKTIWARAKEQWVGMSAEETKKWEDRHEALKAEHLAREQVAKAKKAERNAMKQKKAEIFARYEDGVARLHEKYMAELVAEGLAKPETLPDDADVTK